MPPRREPRVRRNREEPGANAVPPPPPPPPPPRRIEETFLNRNPPTFDGTGDPTDAEAWVRTIEHIFDFLGCNNQERLNCVAFQLKGSAGYWWDAHTRTMTDEEKAQLTWEDFKEEMHDKYVPRSYRKEKEVEFYNLTQGKLTVTEYERTFLDMSRYAPELVDTDAKKAEKFRAGLRHEIRMALASQGELTYKLSYRRALDIEAAMPKEKATILAQPSPQQQHNSRDKRKWDGDHNPYDDKRQQPAQNPLQYGERQNAPNRRDDFRARTPFCTTCSKYHSGKCRFETTRCYNCGGNGHLSRVCPSKNVEMRGRPNYQEPRPQLQALQEEPRRDPASPTHQQQHHDNKGAT